MVAGLLWTAVVLGMLGWLLTARQIDGHYKLPLPILRASRKARIYLAMTATAFACAVIIIGVPYAIGGSMCDNTARGECTRNWLNVFIPLLALVAASAAGAFTYGQMRAAQSQLKLMQSQIAHAKETSRVELRSYVSISRADITFDELGITIILHIKNSGSTPAYNLDCCLWLTGTDERNYPLDQYAANADLSFSVVGPQDVVFKSERLNLPHNHLSEIKNGKAWLFAYGHITFKDIYDDDRRMDFRYEAVLEPDEKWRLRTSCGGNRSYDLSHSTL